jgi:hypothetical protein
MKIGIIQGRLSEPLNGFQECPENWKREFEILPDIGLSHIEWMKMYHRIIYHLYVLII